jgi:alpha-tubulin suppressor-like RCC1 family protein
MWGLGFTGALGVADYIDHAEPVEVPFPHSASADVWAQVACGFWHTLAVTEQGLTYSWGSGEAGQLGHGAKDCFNSPKQIEALSHIRMESIAAAMFNSAGITVEHVLFCWGKGENGQIGTGKSGPTALSVKLPTKVDIKADSASMALSKVTSVVCSDTMTAVLTQAGECVMFGVGKFVNGDQHDILEPLSVRTAGVLMFLVRYLSLVLYSDPPLLQVTMLGKRVGRVACGSSFRFLRRRRALPCLVQPRSCLWQRRPVRPHVVV